ncbi:MAG: HlyD family efflux transporter periplasmic adaptor subunit [Hyphomicrobiales bacterium]|nr:HlyD family efflux transporter periplasmic adaptor subunit [Hyphomicrobiales bacterium]
MNTAPTEVARVVETNLDKISAQKGARAAAPAVAANPEVLALQGLLRLEGEAREIKDLAQFAYFMANETRRIVSARQIYVFRQDGARNLDLAAISSVTSPDRDAPLVRAMVLAARHGVTLVGSGRSCAFAFPDVKAAAADVVAAYPFAHLLFAPFADRAGQKQGVMLLAREQPWELEEALIVERLAGCYGHAWGALRARPARMGSGWRQRRGALAGLALVLLVIAGAWPVHMSALAPAEIVTAHPSFITSPLNGVIRTLDVTPGQVVKQGTRLLHFDDTEIRNQLDVAARDVAVAEAKIDQYSQAAFASDQAGEQVAVAKADYAVKLAQQRYNADELRKTIVLAPRAGVALFDDPRNWKGRPVKIGERIMEIADPARIETRIELDVADSFALKDGAPIRLFLDSDPLHPLQGTVQRFSPEAHVIPGPELTYRLYARLNLHGAPLPQLGLRGTAEIYAAKAPLAYYLLRRPLTFLRQHFGL